MPTLFGTSGVRGPVDTLFTPQFSFDLGRTFAMFLDQQSQFGRICLGIDTRTSSPHIANNLIEGLRYQGREVVHLGALPTPAVHYAHISGGFVAAVMITGSHIDLTSNGVKFFAFKEEITKEQESAISDIYQQIKNQVAVAPLSQLPTQSSLGFDNYLSLLLSLADQPLPTRRIVFDPGNGGQTETIHHLLRQLTQEVIPINNSIQDVLLSRDTELDDAFKNLSQVVVEQKADLGIGFDSDGDRIIFVDHLGHSLAGDISGSLLAKWYAGGPIVCPVNVSQVVEHLHKQVIRTRVGSPFVIEAMKKFGANFGFESNGGCIHEDVMLSRDGGVTLVKMLNILKWSGKSLSELVSEFPQYSLAKTKFSLPKDKYDILYQGLKNFGPPVRTDLTDGVKLYLDDHTWVLFRGSGNAPEFRIFAESLSSERTHQLINDGVSFAQKLIHV